MFYEELFKVENEFKALFDFKILHKIKEAQLDVELSSILVNNDFIIVNLVGKEEQFCPLNIYYGINLSIGYYSLYLNGKAIVYNYEKFDTFSIFENELYHFFSTPITSEMLMTLDNTKIYTDYFINDYEKKKSFSFREYHNKIWWNFLGLKKTKKKTSSYLAWLS